MRRAARLWMLVGMIALAAGCEDGQSVPMSADSPEAVFGRQLVISVVNEGALPAQIFVAEDLGSMGQAVGAVQPSAIPPRTRLDVVFLVPETRDWAIFVNPGPDRGPLLLESDLRGCFGRVPIEIGVGPNGDSYWSAPGRWCGAANNP